MLTACYFRSRRVMKKEKIEENARKGKAALLKALEQSLGNISSACKKVGVARQTFYNYYDNDEKFRQKVEEINESMLDFAETALMKNIKDGKETSLIFYLKTKGRKRGYVEKVENDVTINGFEQLMRDLPDPDEYERNDYDEDE